MLHALIHALLLPRLYAVASDAWNRSCGYDRARSWFYLGYGGYNDLLDVQPDLAADLLEDIGRWDKAAFMESWRILRGWGDDNPVMKHPATFTGPEVALATLEAVGRREAPGHRDAGVLRPVCLLPADGPT